MKDTIYLVFNQEGIVSMRKSVPPLRGGEYATRLDIFVDDKYFKRIIPIAKMEIDDKFLIEPKLELLPIEKPEEMPQGEEVKEEKSE